MLHTDRITMLDENQNKLESSLVKQQAEKKSFWASASKHAGLSYNLSLLTHIFDLINPARKGGSEQKIVNYNFYPS